MMDYPLIIFLLSFLVLWGSAAGGAYVRRRRFKPDDDEMQDLGVVLAATLTLLGLIIGFTFSMAVTRYDQRKNYEEEEANAIGTEYLRVSLLPPAEAARARQLLAAYLNQRIVFYTTRDRRRMDQVLNETTKVQAAAWNTVRGAAATQQTPVVALAVSGLNDVLNSQGYTQAAWRNRIPVAVWGMMGAIAISCNFLFGYAARHIQRRYKLLFVLPLIVAISFFLICDLDTPNGGVIRVGPHNLESLTLLVRP